MSSQEDRVSLPERLAVFSGLSLLCTMFWAGVVYVVVKLWP